jgi:hypothetical protein
MATSAVRLDVSSSYESVPKGWASALVPVIIWMDWPVIIWMDWMHRHDAPVHA